VQSYDAPAGPGAAGAPGAMGDPGPPGAAGPQGPAGAPGAAAKTTRLACRTAKVRLHGRSARRLCAATPIARAGRATLTRGGKTYASGRAIRRRCFLTARRRLPAGRYVLTLRSGGVATRTQVEVR
jgi:hypothetical protein